MVVLEEDVECHILRSELLGPGRWLGLYYLPGAEAGVGLADCSVDEHLSVNHAPRHSPAYIEENSKSLIETLPV